MVQWHNQKIIRTLGYDLVLVRNDWYFISVVLYYLLINNVYSKRVSHILFSRKGEYKIFDNELYLLFGFLTCTLICETDC